MAASRLCLRRPDSRRRVLRSIVSTTILPTTLITCPRLADVNIRMRRTLAAPAAYLMADCCFPHVDVDTAWFGIQEDAGGPGSLPADVRQAYCLRCFPLRLRCSRGAALVCLLRAAAFLLPVPHSAPPVCYLSPSHLFPACTGDLVPSPG